MKLTSTRQPKTGALQHIPLPAFYADCNRRVLAVSPSLPPLLGANLAEASVLDKIREQFGLSDLDSLLKQVFESGLAGNIERFHPSSGHRYSIRFEPLKGPAQENPGIFASFLDIDTLTLSLDSKREENLLYESIFNMTRDPVTVLTKDGRLQNANAAFFHTFRVSPGKIRGKALDETESGGWELSGLEEYLKRLAPGQENSESFEIRHTGPDTGIRTFQVTAHCRVLRTDDDPCIVLVFAPAGIAPGVPAGMQQTIEKLRSSNKALQRFASVAAHDLKEPLAIVSIYSELLFETNQTRLDRESLDHIKSIQETVHKMITLINDLLSFARMDVDTPFEVVEMEEAFNTVMARLQKHIRQAGAVIEHDPLPQVMGNPTLLTQLLQNLLENALKYVKDKKPEIGITVRRKDGKWMFSVRDNGIGFDPKYTTRVFEMFERLHDKSLYPGSGMGLAIAKKIVDHHDGKIEAESTPGKGTTFFFSLPVIDPGK